MLELAHLQPTSGRVTLRVSSSKHHRIGACLDSRRRRSRDVDAQVGRLFGQLLKPIHAGDGELATARLKAEPARSAGKLLVTTSSFEPGGKIPPRFADDHGIAPGLAWGDVPPGAQEPVLLCEDPDAAFPKPFVHWLSYGIAPGRGWLPEGATRETGASLGIIQGKNSAGRVGYVGPKPPPGHGRHRYHFQLFAVDAPLHVASGADRDAVLEVLRGHVLAVGDILGTYENA